MDNYEKAPMNTDGSNFILDIQECNEIKILHENRTIENGRTSVFIGEDSTPALYAHLMLYQGTDKFEAFLNKIKDEVDEIKTRPSLEIFTSKQELAEAEGSLLKAEQSLLEVLKEVGNPVNKLTDTNPDKVPLDDASDKAVIDYLKTGESDDVFIALNRLKYELAYTSLSKKVFYSSNPNVTIMRFVESWIAYNETEEGNSL